MDEPNPLNGYRLFLVTPQERGPGVTNILMPGSLVHCVEVELCEWCGLIQAKGDYPLGHH